MKELLFIALVLACPLMMMLMMRGHGHGGHGTHSDHAHDRQAHHASTDELRRRRDELDRVIEEREQEEALMPFGGARR
jgi:hypothetical protein